jgi:hypothetical protein
MGTARTVGVGRGSGEGTALATGAAAGEGAGVEEGPGVATIGAIATCGVSWSADGAAPQPARRVTALSATAIRFTNVSSRVGC